METTRIEAAEFVLPGHPDKLCDAVADAIVDHVMRGDALGQCGVEVACVFDRVFLTGRVAAGRDVLDALDVEALVRRTYAEAGYGEDAAGHPWGPRPEDLRVTTAFCWGEFEPGEREHRHFADDQAVCVGYAIALAETGHLPPAHWLARRIGAELFQLRRERGAGELGPDGKVLARVAIDGDAWRPLHVSLSLNHHARSDWLLLRRIAEEAVARACGARPLPSIAVNGAGMFVAGGPNGDNGLSGKKLVVDAYGPTVPIGGGAWSGKDFNKVDRLGGMLARALAKEAVIRLAAHEARVELEYEPGCTAPVVRCHLDGRLRDDALGALEWRAALGNSAAARALVRGIPALPALARWGHFVSEAPWERVPGARVQADAATPDRVDAKARWIDRRSA